MSESGQVNKMIKFAKIAFDTIVSYWGGKHPAKTRGTVCLRTWEK